MIPGRGGLRLAALRSVALVSVPILIWVVLASGLSRRDGDGRLESDPIPEIDAELESLLEQAAAVPRTALDRSIYAAAAVPGRLAGRIEGLAVFQDTPDRVLEWQGTPANLPESLWHREGPAWDIVRTGLRSRLISVAGPDSAGRRAAATFLLDSGLEGGHVGDLLPVSVSRRYEVRLGDRPLAGSVGGISVGTTLTDPSGIALAQVVVTPRVSHSGHPREVAAAWAAVVFVVLLAGLFPWARILGSPGGTIAAVIAIAVGRIAFLVTRAPPRLLSPDAGRPVLFGSDEAWGLLSSPADLLLSGLALYLAARSIRAFLMVPERGTRSARFTAGVISALGTTLVLMHVAISVAENGRVRVLGIEGALSSPAIAVLLAGFGSFLLAPAELWAASWRLRPGPDFRRAPAGRFAVAATIVPLAAVASFVVQSTYDRMGLDRLRAEFAPQVAEQSARRRLALTSAIQYTASEAARTLRTAEPTPRALENLAYDLWVGSALFHAGYKSSLTLYDAGGVPRAHFGYDIPALDEDIDLSRLEPGSPVVRAEPFFPLETVRSRLLHAELPIVSEGELLGTLVAHVLDEPENLPFLPGPRSYLACLGTHGPAYGDDDGSSAPEYVRYDPLGVVRYHSVDQPPPWTYEIEKAAIEGRTLRVVAGADPYFALPLVETDSLHLLMVPAPTTLDRMGTFVRLALLGIGMLGVVEILTRVWRPGLWRSVTAGIRRSYYRKLVVALLVASVLPWVGLSLVLQRDFVRRGERIRFEAATQLAVVAQRVIEDYALSQPATEHPVLPDDNLLYWLRRLVQQDIHLYERGELVATSKRELFDAGLLLTSLPSDVHFQVNQLNRPVLVRHERLGGLTIPVAYAPVTLRDRSAPIIVAVPLVLHQPEILRAFDRTIESLLLSTVLLAGLLAAVAAPMARTVARPIRDLVRAAGRIAAGDFGTRLEPRSEDELAELVQSFNTMVEALERNRADLERRRDYMEAMLQYATTGVLSTDAGGRVVTLNPAAEKLLAGASGPPRIGSILPEEVGRDSESLPLAELLSGSPSSAEPVEVDLARDRGARRLRLVRIDLPDPEGGLPGQLILISDVTDLMRRNQLEAWAEMARAIAHEIKNPLTPIQLSTEHLRAVLRDRGALPSPELESCLATIMKQVDALRQIAGEFSTYAKVPSLAPEPTDPAAFLRETLEPYRSAKPSGVEIVERFLPCATVRIDRRILARAVVNLVENALHAMPGGGTLTVEAEPSERSGQVRISIRDTGTGLSPEVRSRLFEPYFSTKSSGTGLGLAIVRRTVEEHGGSIEVEGIEPRGTAFHILLPCDGGRE